MKLHNPGALAACVLTTLALFIGACGDDRAEGYGGTPQPRSTATAITTREATPVLAPSTPAAPASGVDLALVASSLKFDRSALAAPAGPVTISYDNRDDAIPHNLHVFSGDDASGEDLGSTEIQTGPVRQTLELDLPAGSYFYQCDVHPSRMMGTLTVS